MIFKEKGPVTALNSTTLQPDPTNMGEKAGPHNGVIRQKRYLDLVLDSIPGIVWEISGPPTLSHIQVNFISNPVEKITGYKPEELLNGSVSLLDLFHPADRIRFVKDRQEVLRTGTVKPYIYRMVKKTGQEVWVKTYPTILRGRNKKPLGLRSIVLDITKDIAIEKDLVQSETRLKKSIEMASVGICVWNGSRVITQLNKALLRMLKRKAPKQLSLYAVFCKDDAQKFSRAKATVEKRGVFKEFETEVVDGRGNSSPVLVSGVSFSGTERSILLFVTDITQRKENERRKNEFIGIASHELKTPVTSMKIYAELLKRNLDQGSKAYSYTEKLEVQIARLTELIQELLDISKLENNKLSLRREQVNLNVLIKNISRDLEQTFKKHRITVVEKYPVIGYIDQLRITQVLVNLITNAVKYSPKADVVNIYINPEAGFTHIGVQDFGIGISKANQQLLFQPFFRVSGENEKTYPGLGVGLYISRQIVRKHGGDLWVESRRGSGSTFWFTLPSEKAV